MVTTSQIYSCKLCWGHYFPLDPHLNVGWNHGARLNKSTVRRGWGWLVGAWLCGIRSMRADSFLTYFSFSAILMPPLWSGSNKEKLSALPILLQADRRAFIPASVSASFEEKINRSSVQSINPNTHTNHACKPVFRLALHMRLCAPVSAVILPQWYETINLVTK